MVKFVNRFIQLRITCITAPLVVSVILFDIGLLCFQWYLSYSSVLVAIGEIPSIRNNQSRLISLYLCIALVILVSASFFPCQPVTVTYFRKRIISKYKHIDWICFTIMTVHKCHISFLRQRRLKFIYHPLQFE